MFNVLWLVPIREMFVLMEYLTELSLRGDSACDGWPVTTSELTEYKNTLERWTVKCQRNREIELPVSITRPGQTSHRIYYPSQPPSFDFWRFHINFHINWREDSVTCVTMTAVGRSPCLSLAVSPGSPGLFHVMPSRWNCAPAKLVQFSCGAL